MVFSPKAPQAVSTSRSGSDSSGNVSPSASRNLASFAGLSGEMPMTSRPPSLSWARLSRKSQACLVQPGVDAEGGEVVGYPCQGLPECDRLSPSSSLIDGEGDWSTGKGLDVTTGRAPEGFVELSESDKERMTHLYEEVQGRLKEMSLIVARNLHIEISENTVAMLRPVKLEGLAAAPAGDGVEVICTEGPPGTFNCG